MILAGFDLGMTITGWTVGDGSSMPAAGHWEFGAVGEALGELGDNFGRRLALLHRRTGFDHVIAEAPFVDRYRDKVIFLRKNLGLGMQLQTFCYTQGIAFEEVPFGQVKRQVTGNPSAKKPDMVRAARNMGLPLPKGPAAEDVADSFGVWLVGVRRNMPEAQLAWEAKILAAQGVML